MATAIEKYRERVALYVAEAKPADPDNVTPSQVSEWLDGIASVISSGTTLDKASSEDDLAVLEDQDKVEELKSRKEQRKFASKYMGIKLKTETAYAENELNNVPLYGTLDFMERMSRIRSRSLIPGGR